MMRSLIMATTPIASTHQAERLLSSSTVPGSVAGIAWAPQGQLRRMIIIGTWGAAAFEADAKPRPLVANGTGRR
jgi:hypothetical protein